MTRKVVKPKSWPATGWHGLWTKWGEIPCEFRALLIWSFLTSGPVEKEDYFKVMLAMEQWDHSRFSVFNELEIKWMTEAIQKVCPQMNATILDQGIVMFLNIGSSHLTLKKRRSGKLEKHKQLAMINSLNLSSKKMDKVWEWMESWYAMNTGKNCNMEFEIWFSKEIERINEWEKAWPVVFPDSSDKPFNEKFPFLPQSRAFPIDMAGTEIQKTIRLVPNANKVATSWGYILNNPEPEIPYDPYPYFSPLVDPEWYGWFLSQDFIHGQLAFVGGPTGLIDYAREMREAERILKTPKRRESPMSKIMLA